MKILHEQGVPLEQSMKFCGCCGSMFIKDPAAFNNYNQGVMLQQTDDPMQLGEFDTHIVEKLPIPGANIYLKLRTSTKYASHE